MGTPSSNSGDIAKRQEQNRRGLIRGGLSQINSIYGGGAYGVNPASSWDRKNQAGLYTPGGASFATLTPDNAEFMGWLKDRPQVLNTYRGSGPTQRDSLGNILYHSGQTGGLASVLGGFNIFNPFGVGEERKTYSLEDIKGLYGKWLGNQGQLFTGTTTSPGFGGDFYKKRTQDYINYAMPQLQEQAGSAQKNLAFKLQNQGLGESGTADALNLSLLNEINRQASGVASTGVGQAQDLQKQIEQQRSQLISQLETSADPGSATSQALSTAAGFSAPSVFQPVGNLFGNWANTYLASQAGANTNPSLLPYLYGLSSTRSGSGGFMPGNTVQGG
jgi:hypothetical protein